MIAQVDEKTTQKYVSVPLDVLKQVDNPIDALVWGYIEGWENSQRKSKVHMHAGQQRMAEDLGVSTDTITRACQRLISKDLLRMKRTPNGAWYTTRTDICLDAASCVTPEVGHPHDAGRRGTPHDADRKKITCPYNLSSSEGLASANPSSSDPMDDVPAAGRRLPNPLLHRPRLPREQPAGAVLNETQTGLSTQFLGITGEDNKAPSLFTQEQADRKNFVETVFKRCIDSAKKKVVLSRTGFVCKVRDELWNGGRFVDSQTVEDLARYEKRKKYEAFLARLT